MTALNKRTFYGYGYAYGSFEAVPVSSKQYIVKEVGRICFRDDSFATC